MKKATANGEAWTQLATRIEKKLHRELKLYCVKHELPIQEFITAAIRAKLGKGKEGAHA